MAQYARSDDLLIKKHFSVSNYDAVDEENVIEMDRAYLNRGQTSTTVYTFRNIALSVVFIGVTLVAVINFPFNAQNVPSAFTKSDPVKPQAPSMPPPPAAAPTVEAGSMPNFVFILVDDVGYHSIGYDSSDIGFATPYLSSLAKAGVILENYYTQESCAPARASLMTGRYPASIGLQFGEIHPTENFGLNPSETLLPEVLRLEGYKNYALGKWNLGHFHPQYLPTARGFDYFLGYMDGHNYYWSKKDPSANDYYDFMYANQSCYGFYNADDRGTYSTTLYKNKAIDAIEAHDFTSNPMFLYLAVQAAHDPFAETNHELDADYVGDSRYSSVSKIVGAKRQQYAMSLMMLDDAVREVHQALVSAGQKDNTYLIFASDNGGCYEAGGKNGPLRGSKGSLFEGGVKVPAFIYAESALLGTSAGTTYTELFHVSDWFATIVAMISSSYTATKGHKLDGVDHSKTLIKQSADTKKSIFESPRDYLVYNLYLDVEGEDFDVDSEYGFAIRNSRYKLMHFYENTTQSTWVSPADLVDDDDNIDYVSSCSQESAVKGDFNKYLFDLEEDPYETTNLYYDAKYTLVKKELYDTMTGVIKNVQSVEYTYNSSYAYTYWTENDGYIQPFDFDETVYHSYPLSCASYGLFSPTYGNTDTGRKGGKHQVLPEKK